MRRKRAPARHQQLLDGASVRDDVGDVLAHGLELDLRFAKAESMGGCFSAAPVPIAPSCSKISEESAVESVCNFSGIK